jgi:predicted RND superfamily exporter protein
MGVETMTMEEFIGASIQAGSEDPALLQAQQMINENRSQMVGREYNRMVISLAHKSEGDATFKAVGELLDKADEVIGDNYYLVGDTVIGYEMNDGFKSEMNYVTLLTIIAIFVVVIFTFRSIFSSAILVIVIQAAVYMTTAVMAVAGFTINYIALILVQCILMGATIDYGILFVCNYVEERGKFGKKEALVSAMDKSVKTILTSSLILIGCCLTTGLLMSQKVIAQTTSILAFGAAAAVFMVVFVLPVLVFALDKLILMRFGKKMSEAPAEVKSDERKKQPARKTH